MIKNRDKSFYESKDQKQIFSELAISLGLNTVDQIGRTIEDNIFIDKIDFTDECLGLSHNNKPVFFGDVLNMFLACSPHYRNHEISERKLSVRIAKENLRIDAGNKYYSKQLVKAERELNKVLND